MVMTRYNQYPYKVQLCGHTTYWLAHNWCFRNIERGLWSTDFEKPNALKFTLEEDYNLFVRFWMERILVSKTTSNNRYTVEFPIIYSKKRLQWCFDTFDQSSWHCYNTHNSIVYEFKNNEDATLFKLKWL